MQRFCQVLGGLLLSAPLFSGGTMALLVYSGNDFWTSSPLRQHFIPLARAHSNRFGAATDQGDRAANYW